MTEKEMQAMHGQISAIGLVLTSLIAAQEPLQAQHIAVRLSMAMEGENQEDQSNGTPTEESRIRNLFVGMYLELLHSVAAS